MQQSYVKPQLSRVGTIEDVTRASFNNSQQDSIFFNGVIVGNAHGSLDACISLNPQNPQGTCNVPTP